jgi:hypothetical protein
VALLVGYFNQEFSHGESSNLEGLKPSVTFCPQSSYRKVLSQVVRK